MTIRKCSFVAQLYFLTLASSQYVCMFLAKHICLRQQRYNKNEFPQHSEWGHRNILIGLCMNAGSNFFFNVRLNQSRCVLELHANITRLKYSQ